MRVSGVFQVDKVEDRGQFRLVRFSDGDRHISVCDFSEQDYKPYLNQVVTVLFDIYYSKAKNINTFRFVGVRKYD